MKRVFFFCLAIVCTTLFSGCSFEYEMVSGREQLRPIDLSVYQSDTNLIHKNVSEDLIAVLLPTYSSESDAQYQAFVHDLGLQKPEHLVLFDATTSSERLLAAQQWLGRQIPKGDVQVYAINSSTKVEALSTQLPAKTVIISFYDLPTYEHATVAAFHHAIQTNIIQTLDTERLEFLFPGNHDNAASVQAVMQIAKQRGAFRVQAMTQQQAETDVYIDHPVWYVSKGEPLVSSQYVSMLQFGDVMLDRSVAIQINKFGPQYLLEEIGGTNTEFFQGIDIVTANLEGPFADTRRPTSKSIAFRFDPDLISMLQTYKFNLFNLANNHSLDMGHAGFAESKKHLQQAGIDVYGEQLSVDEDALLVKEVHGKKIAFIGLDDTIVPVEIENVQTLIQQVKDRVDAIVVNIHWGVEYQPISSQRQQELARALIDSGVDVILGHHPHVVEEIEVYKGKPIFYSLGNFIFDQYFSVETQQGLAVMLLFGGDQTVQARVLPFKSEKSRVVYMSPDEEEKFMKELIARSRLNTTTDAVIILK